MEAVLVSGAQAIQNDNYGKGECYDGSWRHRSPSEPRRFSTFSPGKNANEGRRGSRSIEQGIRNACPTAISIYPDEKKLPKRKEKRVRINISGMRYETLESTLDRFPTTLLGCPEKRVVYFDPSKKEYFFDRNRVTFDSILYFYQSNGKLLRPLDVDMQTFVDEIYFFELEDQVSPHFIEAYGDCSLADIMPKNRIQRKMWEVLEYPHSSLAAQVVAVLSVSVILLSIIVFCLETLPSLRETRNEKSSALYKIEIFCVAWFTIEFVLRLAMSPKKLEFLRSFLNIIDLLAILPYYIILGVGDAAKEDASLLAFLRILRLVRVFRIFKLSRHYRGLKVLGKTLKASLRELLLLTFFLLMGVIVFSSGVYYAESAHFSSIPEAFWFSVVTMTTVGYGDKAPISPWGKAVGSLCAIAGVLTLALPVPVIVSNFSYFYNQDKERRTGDSSTAKIKEETPPSVSSTDGRTTAAE